jgi:hypothetical protein
VRLARSFPALLPCSQRIHMTLRWFSPITNH